MQSKHVDLKIEFFKDQFIFPYPCCFVLCLIWSTLPWKEGPYVCEAEEATDTTVAAGWQIMVSHRKQLKSSKHASCQPPGFGWGSLQKSWQTQCCPMGGGLQSVCWAVPLQGSEALGSQRKEAITNSMEATEPVSRWLWINHRDLWQTLGPAQPAWPAPGKGVGHFHRMTPEHQNSTEINVT